MLERSLIRAVRSGIWFYIKNIEDEIMGLGGIIVWRVGQAWNSGCDYGAAVGRTFV